MSLPGAMETFQPGINNKEWCQSRKPQLMAFHNFGGATICSWICRPHPRASSNTYNSWHWRVKTPPQRITFSTSSASTTPPNLVSPPYHLAAVQMISPKMSPLLKHCQRSLEMAAIALTQTDNLRLSWLRTTLPAWLRLLLGFTWTATIGAQVKTPVQLWRVSLQDTRSSTRAVSKFGLKLLEPHHLQAQLAPPGRHSLCPMLP